MVEEALGATCIFEGLDAPFPKWQPGPPASWTGLPWG
jgi:hypothetical protein